MDQEHLLLFFERLAEGTSWEDSVVRLWLDLRATGVEKWVGSQKVRSDGLAFKNDTRKHCTVLHLYDGTYRVYTHQEPGDEYQKVARLLRAADDLVRDREYLKEAAMHDPLTGCLNRKGLQEWFDNRLLRFPNEIGFTLVLFDLDNFKRLNDTQGHQKGDEALVAIAQAFRAQLRRFDVLARIGGDEFVAILESSSSHPGIRHRLETIKQTLPLDEYQIGVSMGVCHYPCNGSDLSQLISLADNLMYQGKRKGKGEIVMAEEWKEERRLSC